MKSNLLAFANRPLLNVSKCSLLNYPKHLKFSTQTPVYLGRNKQLFSPKQVENPSFDDKNLEFPPSNAGEPDLHPPEKTDNDILFPWKYDNQTPRLNEPTYHSSPFLEKIPFIPKSFNLPLSRFMTSFFFSALNSDKSYFQGEFLHGARLAFERISYCITHKDYDNMEKMMSDSLYQKYSKALKDLTEQNGKVKIEVLESYFPEIIETFVTFGNPRGLNLNDKGFFPLFYNTNTIIFSRDILEKKKMDKGSIYVQMKLSPGLKTGLSSGYKTKLYVKVPAKVRYVLENKDGTIVDHIGKYDHVVVMTSQQFLPTPTLSIKPDQWEWQVEDIDYLIEKDELEEKTNEVDLHFKDAFLKDYNDNL